MLVNSLPRVEDDVEAWLQVAHRLWVAKHDVAEDVANLAQELWTKANMEVRHLYFVISVCQLYLFYSVLFVIS